MRNNTPVLINEVLNVTEFESENEIAQFLNSLTAKSKKHDFLVISDNKAYKQLTKRMRAKVIKHSYECVKKYKGECDYAIIIADNLDSLDIKATATQLEHKFKGLEIYIWRKVKELSPMVAYN